MNSASWNMIRKYAELLSKMEGYSTGGWKILVSLDGKIYETINGCSFENLKISDVTESDMRKPETATLSGSEMLRAMVLSDTPCCHIFAEKGKTLYSSLDDMAQIIGPSAEAVPYETGEIARALGESAACFVKGKYTVTAGRSLYEAVTALEVLEKSAEVHLKAEFLGGVEYLPFSESQHMRSHYLENYSRTEMEIRESEDGKEGNSHERKEYPLKQEAAECTADTRQEEGAEREYKLRGLLVEYGLKLADCGLVQGTWGNLSVRLDDRYMLVTPSGIAYEHLTPSDMVKAEIVGLEFEGRLKPTSEKGLHAGIYRKRKDVSAIIHTHCHSCSVFAASERDVPVDADNAYMSGRFENPVKTAAYALPGSDALWQNTIEALSENSGCLMAHHGMLCTGGSLEEAFENCCMLETYCEEYIADRYKRPVCSKADRDDPGDKKFCEEGEVFLQRNSGARRKGCASAEQKVKEMAEKKAAEKTAEKKAEEKTAENTAENTAEKAEEASAGSLKHIVEQQREFFNREETRQLHFRKNALIRLRRNLKQREENLLEALEKDLGKSPYEAYATEIGLIYSEISYMLKHLNSLAQPKRVRTPLTAFPGKSVIYQQPYGVTLIMSPWNYPAQLTLIPLIGAIAAGNCAVVKPSAYAPETASVLADILGETFSDNYVYTVLGGRTANRNLLKQHFDYIFFTGGKEVGRTVMKAASEHLTPVTLELGGKSPCIVDETADIAAAARRIVWGKFINCGQTCVAPDYVLVHESVKERLLEAMVRNIEALYGQEPLCSRDYGRIVNRRHYDRLAGLLAKETPYYFGGYDEAACKIGPVILDDADWSSACMQEEIFGPVLPVLTFENLREVKDRLDLLPRPLALYLFTRDRRTEKAVMEGFSFGGGCVNDTVMHLASSKMPFGGIGESGMGAYHGKYSFRTFSHEKSVLKKGRFPDLPMRYAPYPKGLSLLKLFLR